MKEPSLGDVSGLGEKKVDLGDLINLDREPVVDEDECVSAGGKWGRRGSVQVYGCWLPAKDSGKPCMTTKDCEVACLYVGDPVLPLNPDPEVRREATKSSVCAPYSPLFGCWTMSFEGNMYDVCID